MNSSSHTGLLEGLFFIRTHSNTRAGIEDRTAVKPSCTIVAITGFTNVFNQIPTYQSLLRKITMNNRLVWPLADKSRGKDSAEREGLTEPKSDNG